jgi:hypothetical protein
MLFVQLETGLPKTQVQLRKEHSNMSLPQSWTEDTFALLNVARVEKTEAPAVGQYQTAQKDGIENVGGVWKEKWKVVDMFQDYTDDEGVTHTKAEQESAYQADLDAKAKEAAIAKINATFEEEIAAVKEGYLEDEIKSWPQQVAEAQAYQADNTAVTPLLDAMVATKGGTKDELVLRIATNATQYAQVFGAALGKKQKAIADLG